MLRYVDAWVGKPLCFALTRVRRLSRALGFRAGPTGAVRKILFIKLIERGSTVLACEAVKRAERLVGPENVYICVFEQNREILDVLSIIPRANQFSIRTGNIFELVVGTLRVIAQVRRLKIDAIIDMEFFARGSAILAYLCGGTRRVGMHGFMREAPYRGNLMTHRVAYSPYVHTAHTFALLVEALAHSPAEVPLLKAPVNASVPFVPSFRPAKELTRRVGEMLAGNPEGEVGSPIIVFNPDTQDPLRVRKWPGERYVELGKRLLREYPNALIVLTGMPSERGDVEVLCEAIGSPSAVNLAGLTNLWELMTLYTLADVLVTNDSGPAHFASATGIHRVVFFGPETPTLFGPLGDRTRIIYKRLACSPCVSAYNNRFSPCRDNVCIHSITVDEVYDLVQECLAAREQLHLEAASADAACSP